MTFPTSYAVESTLRDRHLGVILRLRRRADGIERSFASRWGVKDYGSIYREAMAAAARGEVTQAVEITDEVTDEDARLRMRVALDVPLFDQIIEAAEREKVHAAVELTELASDDEATQEMRIGVDVVLFTLSVEAAQAGDTAKAIELTKSASTPEVERAMRAGLNGCFAELAVQAADEGEVGKTLSLVELITTPQGRVDARVMLDPYLAKHAIGAFEIDQSHLANDHARHIYSPTIRNAVLTQIGGSSESDIRFNALTASAPPSSRRVLWDFGKAVVIAVDEFVADAEFAAVAIGADASSLMSAGDVSAMLSERKLDVGERDVSQLILALDSARSGLWLDSSRERLL